MVISILAACFSLVASFLLAGSKIKNGKRQLSVACGKTGMGAKIHKAGIRGIIAQVKKEFESKESGLNGTDGA
jgi:ribose 5-phosphate isomerase RpiB